MDLTPAQTPTFYNPVIDVPLWILAHHLPARAVGFVLGAGHGVAVAVIARLGFGLLPIPDRRFRAAAASALALAGGLGGGTLGELGSTSYEDILCLPIAAGLVALAAAHGPGRSEGGRRQALLLAGLLAGLAAGLKLPLACWPLGVTLAAVLAPPREIGRVKATIAVALGAALGMAATGGAWMVFLWRDFGNPVLPYFNEIFHSPWAEPGSNRDLSFVPATLSGRLLFPFTVLAHPLAGGEAWFRDAKIALLYSLAVTVGAVVAGAGLLGRPLAPGRGPTGAGRAVLVAAGGAYAAWLGLFCIYRYSVPLEMMAPLLAVLIALRLPGRAGPAVAAAVVAIGLVAKPPPAWRPWSDRFIAVEAAAPLHPGDMVVMTGMAPTSYVLPTLLPAEVPAIRIDGNFYAAGQPPTAFSRALHSRIAAHTGRFWALFNESDRSETIPALADFGLRLEPARCRAMRSNIDWGQVVLCPAERLGTDAR